jgi:hypothetical protein
MTDDLFLAGFETAIRLVNSYQPKRPAIRICPRLGIAGGLVATRTPGSAASRRGHHHHRCAARLERSARFKIYPNVKEYRKELTSWLWLKLLTPSTNLDDATRHESIPGNDKSSIFFQEGSFLVKSRLDVHLNPRNHCTEQLPSR